MLARVDAGLEGAAKDVIGAGGRAVTLPTDVSDFEAVTSAAAQVENEIGPIDVWVKNAMTTVFARQLGRSIQLTFNARSK